MKQFLLDFRAALRGEYEPMRKWGVHLSAKSLAESGETVAESVARQYPGFW